MGSPRAVGLAVYFEFRHTNKTQQFIVTGENTIKDPETGELVPVPLCVWWRAVSQANPRKRWVYALSPKVSPAEGVGPILNPVERMEYALEVSFPIFNYIQLLISNENDWRLYGSPLVVEMSKEDVKEVFEGLKPDGLERRIVKARKEANFEDSFWDTSAAVN